MHVYDFQVPLAWRFCFVGALILPKEHLGNKRLITRSCMSIEPKVAATQDFETKFKIDECYS